ncbi:hypothetical protein chiPu_0020852, partial [Chiloscyllium punctatum]|nr:hypothetical protein [Chiloscyllium punctatum]
GDHFTWRSVEPEQSFEMANIWEKLKSEQRKELCSVHKEKVKLFCKTDNQPMCVVCQSSKSHQSHELLPLEEATEEFKEELRSLLKPVQDKKKECDAVRNDYKRTLSHIQDQGVKTEKQIKAEFEKLHRFLREEERIVLKDLKLEKEEKCREMKERIEEITKEISSLSVTVQDIEQELREQDSIKFLTVNSPITLDSNTAHPDLLLSEDLSTVSCHGKQQQLPRNPERFVRSVQVLALEGFTSGKHSWEVEVGNQTEWAVGVVNESINRKEAFSLIPGNGYWSVKLRDGNKNRTGDTSSKRSEPGVNMKKIRVCLDYEGGKVSFYNSENKTHIYTFTGTFTEKLYPFFSSSLMDGSKNTDLLTICPRRVTIQEDEGFVPIFKQNSYKEAPKIPKHH